MRPFHTQRGKHQLNHLRIIACAELLAGASFARRTQQKGAESLLQQDSLPKFLRFVLFGTFRYPQRAMVNAGFRISGVASHFKDAEDGLLRSVHGFKDSFSSKRF